MIVCPNCGAHLPKSAKVCAKCWKVLPDTPENINKAELELEIKRYLAMLDVPKLMRIDSHIKLTAEDINIIEKLKIAVNELERRFGELVTDVDAYMILGNVSLGMGDFEDTLRYYEIAENIKPNAKEIYHNRGVAYYRMKKYDEAVQAFNKVLELDQLFALAHYSKAMALMYSGKLHDGIKAYEMAVKINPDFKKHDWAR